MNRHKEAHEFLSGHHLGVLSTVSAEGSPWGAAIYYVTGDHFSVYFLTATNGQKYEDMQANSKVAFTVVDDDTQTTVQLMGKVDRLPIGNEMDKAYRDLAGIHVPGSKSWEPPVSKLHQAELAVMRITPDFLQIADYKEDGEDHEYISRVI